MQRVVTPILCTLVLTLATLATAAAQTASVAPPQEAKIEVVDWTNRRSPSGTHQYIEGVVRNSGTAPATFVRIKVKALDAQERLVSVHDILADPSNLAPGEEATFSRPIPDSDEIVYFSLAAHWDKAVQATPTAPTPTSAAQQVSDTRYPDKERGNALLGFVLLLVVFVLYFLPAIVASRRGHHNSGAIFALTLLAGWTGLGWLIAFIWSLTAVRPVAPAPPDATDAASAAR